MKLLTAVVLAAATLVSLGGDAVAQYSGPIQRNFRGEPCPPGSYYQGGMCTSTNRAPDPSPTNNNDWRKSRERALEDSQLTVGQKQRYDWRDERQRQIEDRFGK